MQRLFRSRHQQPIPVTSVAPMPTATSASMLWSQRCWQGSSFFNSPAPSQQGSSSSFFKTPPPTTTTSFFKTPPLSAQPLKMPPTQMCSSVAGTIAAKEAEQTTRCGEGWYTGEKNEAGERHGEGTYRDGGDYRYVGRWKNDKQHGKGKVYTQQESYEGEFSEGRRHGPGVLKMLRKGEGPREELLLMIRSVTYKKGHCKPLGEWKPANPKVNNKPKSFPKAVCVTHGRTRLKSCMKEQDDGTFTCVEPNLCGAWKQEVSKERGVCAVHGKERGMRFLQKTEDGTLECVAPNFCVNRDGKRAEGRAVCAIHGKTRDVRFLEEQHDGTYECVEPDICGISRRHTPPQPQDRF